MSGKNRIAAQAEGVKLHPHLVAIVAALLDGRPCSEIAREFGLEEAAVRSYAREAGLLPGKASVPEGLPWDPPTRSEEEEESADAEDLEDSPSEEEPISDTLQDQVVEQDARSREDPEVPRSKEELFDEERHDGLEALRAAARAEQVAYEAQAPRPVLRIVGEEDWRPGFQSAARASAILLRQQAERAERVRQWYAADLFRWRQPPPDDL